MWVCVCGGKSFFFIQVNVSARFYRLSPKVGLGNYLILLYFCRAQLRAICEELPYCNIDYKIQGRFSKDRSAIHYRLSHITVVT